MLLEAAAGDPGTAFGAVLAGWAYPASTRELIELSAQIGDQKAARKVMPWALRLQGDGPRATADEVAAANAELEDGIVFT